MALGKPMLHLAMSKAEQTKQFIIETAAPIFNLKGYENTSLSDIQEATRLTKGAIYGNFSDKNELALAAYEYISSLVIKRIGDRMRDAVSPGEALLSYPEYYVQHSKSVLEKGGCALMNAAVEADDYLYFMRDAVRKSIKRFIKLLEGIIEKGQSENVFKDNINAAEYATLIFSIMEGNIMLAKIMNDAKYFQIAVKRIKNLVRTELES